MSWTYLSSSHPKARKEYRCGLCGLRIRKGSRHLVISGNMDGEFVSERRHEVCASATDEWDEMDWETRSTGDEPEFRRYELGLPLIDLEKVP
jgi:hypothetical protein